MAPKNAAAKKNGGFLEAKKTEPAPQGSDASQLRKGASSAREVKPPGSDAIRRLVGYDRVVKLFDEAGAGEAKDKHKPNCPWAKRFQLHASETLEGKPSSLPKADILSLKFDFLQIVEERLNDRCKQLDTKLADSLEDFHMELKHLFNETLALARNGEDPYDFSQERRPTPDATPTWSPSQEAWSPSPMEASDNDSAFKFPSKERDKVQSETDLDDGEGSWFDGRMSVRDDVYPGVSSFVAGVALARRPAAERSYELNTLRFDESWDEDAAERRQTVDPSVSMRLKSMLRQENNENVVDNSVKYKDIHKNCKSRVRSLQQEDDKEKVVSAGQLREIMYGCLKQKQEKDVFCTEKNQAMLTLEHFLYEFLETRYSSTNAKDVKEWFSALNRSINKHGLFDCEFCIFGKMLKNALPESFPAQQRILQQAAEKHLKELMGPGAWNLRNYNGVPLKTFETLVDQLFNKFDCTDIMKRVKDPLPKTGKRYAQNMEALASGNVRYQYGVEVILTFNMNIQDDFLASFVKDFRAVDVAHDGLLSSSGLQTLAENYSTLDRVRDGSLEYTMLADAKAAVLRSIRKARRMTFTEAATHFIDLQNARWTITRKQGSRYSYHDKLKGKIDEIEKEKERKLAQDEAYKNKSERQKRIANTGKGDQSDPESPKKLSMMDGKVRF